MLGIWTVDGGPDEAEEGGPDAWEGMDYVGLNIQRWRMRMNV